MLPSRIVVVAGSVFFVVAALASTAATTTTSDVVVRRSFVFGGFSPGDDGATTRRSFVVVEDASSSSSSPSVPSRSSTGGKRLAESSIVSIRGGGGGGDEDESYDEYDEYDDDTREEEEEGDDDDDEYEVEYDGVEEEEEEERGEEAEAEAAVAEEMEDSLNAAVDLAVGCAKKIGVILGRATVEASRAVQRAAEAGLAAAKEDEEREELGEEEEEGREVASIAAKIGRLLSRMWKAAVNTPPPKGEQEATTAMGDDGVVCVDGEVFRKEGRRGAARPARSRGVDDDRGSGGSSTTILGGTLTDALQSARSEARLLVAFVPASRRKSSSYDQIAVRSLTSPDVTKIVDRRPVKTKKKDRGKTTGGGGSFAIWSASHGSKEATTAVKRLKVKTPSNKKSPILAVAYPAQVLDRTTGRPKVVPRLLAQHHCNPPPTPSSLASWLDALRKRHAKQYGSMLRELQEMEYHRERREGYKSSVSGDREREQREQAEAKRREEERRREKERLKQLERRREALKESLPPEPSADDRSAMTIALRFVDGRTGRRRFDPETDLNVLFDWVDAEYGYEREKVTLTTMDGRKSFEFREDDDNDVNEEDEGAWEVKCGITLREAGLKRMTALRVSERKEEEEEEEEDNEEEEDR